MVQSFYKYNIIRYGLQTGHGDGRVISIIATIAIGTNGTEAAAFFISFFNT